MGEREATSTTTLRDLDGPRVGGGDGEGERLWGALPCRVGGGVAARVGRAGGGAREGDGARGAIARAAGGGEANLAFSVRGLLGAWGSGTVGIGVEVEAGRGGGDC